MMEYRFVVEITASVKSVPVAKGVKQALNDAVAEALAEFVSYGFIQDGFSVTVNAK